MDVTKIIHTLIQTMDSQKRHTLVKTGGRLTSVTSSINKPNEEKNVLQFEEKIGYRLPDDYRLFLVKFNGVKIFQELLDGRNIGGGLELFSIQEIVQNLEYMDPNNKLLPIGKVEQQFLTISLEAIEKKNPNYLFLLDHIDGPRSLHLNVELFLDRFIVSQGSVFWEWPIYTAVNYYH
ncbi:SMI1/KNR4 family protein [Paenisporosarcina sp. NPDC076898]|uniref:SMI1/KNR4 family protein n=1 Tax=unclassified Paenisporosarcina TaxID=2642018 RepID=UPI003D03CC20